MSPGQVHRFLHRLAAVVAAVVISGVAVHADTLTLDDFESYTSGQILGTGATTTPWGRAGNSVITNPSASDVDPINGSLSGRIRVAFTAANNFVSLRRIFDSPVDLSAFTAISVAMRVERDDAQASTPILLGVELHRDGTTFRSTANYALAGENQTFTFDLDSAGYTRVEGSSDFATVLGGATRVILRVTSSPASEERSSLVFDDLTAIPEPGSVALLSVASVLLLCRCR